MRELISLQAIGLSPNAAAGLPYQIGGQATSFYPVGPEATGAKP